MQGSVKRTRKTVDKIEKLALGKLENDQAILTFIEENDVNKSVLEEVFTVYTISHFKVFDVPCLSQLARSPEFVLGGQADVPLLAHLPGPLPPSKHHPAPTISAMSFDPGGLAKNSKLHMIPLTPNLIQGPRIPTRVQTVTNPYYWTIVQISTTLSQIYTPRTCLLVTLLKLSHTMLVYLATPDAESLEMYLPTNCLALPDPVTITTEIVLPRQVSGHLPG